MRCLTITLVIAACVATAKTGGKPPRGYDTWNAFGFEFTEETIDKQAAYMNTTLAGGKYEYLVLDEGWEHPGSIPSDWVLNENGFPIPAPNKFPSSIAANGTLAPLADNLMKNYGQVLGLWLIRGVTSQAIKANLTFQGTPLSEIADYTKPCDWHLDVFALNMSHPMAQPWYDAMFAFYVSWGVGYFKVDCIAGSNLNMPNIRGVANAVGAAGVNPNTGKQAFLSLSPGSWLTPFEQEEITKALAPVVESSSFRIADDMHDCWANGQQLLSNCVTYNAYRFSKFQWTLNQNEGVFLDGDMYPIGGYGLDTNQHLSPLTQPNLLRFMLGLWSLLQSPAIISGNVTRISEVPGAVAVVNNTYLPTIHSTSERAQLLSMDTKGTLFNKKAIGHTVWSAAMTGSSTEFWLGFFVFADDDKLSGMVNVTIPVSSVAKANSVDSMVNSNAATGVSKVTYEFFEIFSRTSMNSLSDQVTTGNITFSVPVNDAYLFKASQKMA